METTHHSATTDLTTKFRILDAMDSLMNDTPLVDLTVTEICKAAELSRQTFYRHFIDKFHVVRWYWNLLGEAYLEPAGRTLTWYQSNVGMFTELAKRPAFWRHALKENEHYGSCGAFARRRRRGFLVETVTVYRGMPLTDELLFEIDFLLEAESRIVAYWIMSEMKIPPEQFAGLIEKCIPRDLYELLAVPNQDVVHTVMGQGAFSAHCSLETPLMHSVDADPLRAGPDPLIPAPVLSRTSCVGAGI